MKAKAAKYDVRNPQLIPRLRFCCIFANFYRIREKLKLKPRRFFFVEKYFTDKMT